MFNSVKMVLLPLMILLLSVENLFAIKASDIFNNSKGSVVLVQTFDIDNKPLMIGSGFFITPQIVATNYHVIKGATNVKIKLQSGKIVKIGNIIGINTERDLVLMISPEIEGPLSLSERTPQIGEEIIAIGNPQGLELTLSNGIVSGIRKESGLTFYQITAPISPGSSGGPVIDEKGKVLGISTFQFVQGQNLNFAMPSIYLDELLKSPKKETIVAVTGEKIRAKIKDNKLTTIEKKKKAYEWYEKALATKELLPFIPKFKRDLKKCDRKNDEECLNKLMSEYKKIWKKADGELDNAIELYPDFWQAYFQKAKIRVIIEDTENYYKPKDFLIRLHPFDLIGIYPDEFIKLALKDCNRALDLKPNFADGYYYRAFLYWKLKDFEKSEYDMKISISLNTKEGEKPELLYKMYRELSDIFESNQSYDKSLESLYRALEVIPDGLKNGKVYNYELHTYRKLSEIYTKMGNYKEGIKLLDEYIDKRPDLVGELLYDKAEIYTQVGEYDSAIDVWTAYINIDKSLFGIEQKAKCYILKGDFESAIVEFEKYVREWNDEKSRYKKGMFSDLYDKPPILGDLSKCYYKSGLNYIDLNRKDEGIKRIRKAAELGNKDAIEYLN